MPTKKTPEQQQQSQAGKPQEQPTAADAVAQRQSPEAQFLEKHKGLMDRVGKLGDVDWKGLITKYGPTVVGVIQVILETVPQNVPAMGLAAEQGGNDAHKTMQCSREELQSLDDIITTAAENLCDLMAHRERCKER